MALGKFAYANHGTTFLACPPLSDQRLAVVVADIIMVVVVAVEVFVLEQCLCN